MLVHRCRGSARRFERPADHAGGARREGFLTQGTPPMGVAQRDFGAAELAKASSVGGLCRGDGSFPGITETHGDVTAYIQAF